MYRTNCKIRSIQILLNADRYAYYFWYGGRNKSDGQANALFKISAGLRQLSSAPIKGLRRLDAFSFEFNVYDFLPPKGVYPESFRAIAEWDKRWHAIWWAVRKEHIIVDEKANWIKCSSELNPVIQAFNDKTKTKDMFDNIMRLKTAMI